MHAEPSRDPPRRLLPSLTRWTQLRLPSSSVQVSNPEWLEQQVSHALDRLQQPDIAHDRTPHAHIRQAFSNWIREVSAESLRDGPSSPPSGQSSAEASDSALEAAIGRQALVQYERALQKLDDVEREAVIARIELGVTYQAIATALGSQSADAARDVVRQAIVHLALLMNDDAV